MGVLFAGAYAHTARAERPQPVSEVKTLHEWQPLAPLVTRVPWVQWENGIVEVVGLLRGGTVSGSVAVAVSSYPGGVYTVDAVTRASGTFVLGTMTITTGTIPATTGSGGIITVPISDFVGNGSVKFGGTNSQLPEGFSPFDVEAIALSNSNGGVVGTAVIPAEPYGGYLTALSPVTASGIFAPGAGGYAMLHAATPPFVIPGPYTPLVATEDAAFNTTSGHIGLHAHGLPASTTLTYAVDGVDLGAATTDAAGNLNIYTMQGTVHFIWGASRTGKLPPGLNLFTVTTLTVHDSSGNVYLSAGF